MSEELAIISSSATEKLPPPKVYGAWATIFMGVAIGIFALLAMPLLVEVVFQTAELAFNLSPVSYGLIVVSSTIATGLSGMALIDMVIRMNGNRSIVDYIGLRRLNWKIVFLALAAFIIVLVCIIGIGVVYEYFFDASGNASNSDFMDDAYSSVSWWSLWMATVVFAPVFEESFFRGFLFAGLQRSRLGVIGTITITSLVWAALHLQYNLFGMFTIVVMGIVLGVTRYKTHSLWSTIIVHAMWNGMVLVSTMLVS